MKTYVCDKCEARVDEDDVVIHTHPDLWNYYGKLGEALVSESIARGDPHESLPYHKTQHYSRNGRCCSLPYARLCGPLHEETAQEYFIHWISR